MKVLVMSDSHGHNNIVNTIYHRFKDEVEHFIHCGDIVTFDHMDDVNRYIMVAGNCDFHPSLPPFDEVEVGTHRVLVTHGHELNIKYSLQRMLYFAKQQGSDVVFYGHTHFPSVEKVDDIYFINPGSIFANRGIRGRTFALVDLAENVTVHFYDADTCLPLNL